MQNAQINVNGQILSPQDAKISVFDRAFLYGDSLYEVVRSYQGEFYLLDDHLRRLEKSAELCYLNLGKSLSFYRDEIYRTFELFRAQAPNPGTEAYARIIISRGTGQIGFGLSQLTSPSLYTIIIQPVEAPTSEQYRQGMKLQIGQRLRNRTEALDPAMKSGNYLNSLLAYLEANQEGFPDALLCNADGHITEGTTFNIFYVRRGIIATPPLDIGILDGITRRQVIQLAMELNLSVREVRFPKERLYEADEVFLTSSIKEVFPVVQIDKRKIGSGVPGKLTQKLHTAYRQALQNSLKTKELKRRSL
jgi:branched-chain amino acid aminotransferase